jgi:hypothetical protein
LKEVGEFAWNEARAIPGDDGILLEKKGKSYLRMSDSSERQLPFINLGVFWPDARFLNDKELAGFVSTDSLAVMRLDGTLLYQKPVTQLWRLNEILPTASGSRFCFHEAGYTTLNSIVNFLDIENTRPFNTQTITVFETESGRPVFRSEWDPRPYVGPLAWLIHHKLKSLLKKSAANARWVGVSVGDPHTGLQAAPLASPIVFRDSSALSFREGVVEQARPATRSCRARRLGRDLEKASRWPCARGYSELFCGCVRRS